MCVRVCVQAFVLIPVSPPPSPSDRELIDGKDTGSDEEAENDAMDFKVAR